MSFEFEARKQGGGGRSVQPDHAAVRITKHKEGKDKRNADRFYICLNKKAVQIARLIPGDRLTVGFNPTTRQIAVKRDNENGFAVSGSALEKGRGNAAFQVAVETGSGLAVAVSESIGEWLSISEADGMLVTKAQ